MTLAVALPASDLRPRPGAGAGSGAAGSVSGGRNRPAHQSSGGGVHTAAGTHAGSRMSGDGSPNPITATPADPVAGLAAVPMAEKGTLPRRFTPPKGSRPATSKADASGVHPEAAGTTTTAVCCGGASPS